MRSGGDGRRSVAIALLSTAVFATVVVVAITHAPGWPEVKRQFLDWDEFKATFPEIAHAFRLNVKIFCIAEVFILVFALFLAVLRSLPGPVFFPLRALAIVYADLFRGIPTILVIAMLGFGAPALGLNYVPTSTIFWGIVALVLIYSAYVSEVYRNVNAVQRRIGIVFQSYNLFPHMTCCATSRSRRATRCGSRRTRQRAARTRSSSASVSPTSGTTTPTACRAASSSGSRSCGPSPCNRS